MQFAVFLAVAVVAFVLWLAIIYLPGRTLEHRYDGVVSHRHVSHHETSGSEKDESASRSGSGQTR